MRTALIKRVLNFLAGIGKDCTGYSFALLRRIEEGTDLSRCEIEKAVRMAEKEGLVETIRTNLPGPDGLISVTITEKGRVWMEKGLIEKPEKPFSRLTAREI